VHPTDPQTLLVGTQAKGLFLTRDGGSTFKQIVGVPNGTATGDPSMTGIVLSSQRAFVGIPGAGVYESADGAQTWKAIGGPARVNHAVLTRTGAYLASDATSGALWRWSDGQWTKVLPDGSSAHALAVDPIVAGRIGVTQEGGMLRISVDDGRTWTENNWALQQASTDIPWLKDSGSYLSSGGLAFDPKVRDRISQSAGVGVWDLDVPPVPISWNAPMKWASRSLGIEQLVTNDMVAPAQGLPTLANWDRALFSVSNPDAFPTSYSPPGFNMSWDVDYASTNPLFQVSVINWWDGDRSGFSVDGGKSWQPFAARPASAEKSVGGMIAASTPQNFVWVPSGNRRPAFTMDGGKSWLAAQLPSTDYSGLHTNYYLSRHTLSADRVTPGVFYLYDANEKTPGVLESRDGGRTWAKVFTGQPVDWAYWNAQMVAVPGLAGHLLFSSGPQGNGPRQRALELKLSKDGGRSWSALPNAKVLHFGFGAPITAGRPASIYMWGEVNDVRGIWGSADLGRSWVSLGSFPLGSLDNIKVVSGDMARPGRVYVGFGGSGWAYLDP
jgi:hypothetical protein